MKILRKFQLRSALLLQIVAQIVGTVTIITYLSFRNGYRSVRNVSEQLLQEVSERAINQLQEYLDTPHQLVQTYSRSRPLDYWREPVSEDLEKFFWRQSQILGDQVGTIAFADENGQFWGANKKEGYIVSTTNGDLIRYRVNEQGERQSILKKSENYDARDRKWYKTAVEKGKPAWSAISPSTFGNRLDISAVLPLYNEDNSLVGVFVCHLSLVQFSDFLENLKIGKSGQSFIIEPDGTIVATSKGEKLFRQENDKVLRLSAQNSKDNVTRSVAQMLLKSENVPHRMKLQDQTYFIKVTPIKDDRGLDLRLAIVVPEADFLEEINISTFNTLMLCLLLSGIAGGVGVLTSLLISRPVTQLTIAAESITKGNFNQKVDVVGFIEIERLGNAFNSMAIQLKSLFATMEKKVIDRTAKLAIANAQVSKLNQQLRHDNLRLSQELDIARQIQAMVIPKATELVAIPDLDIGAYMKPATNVGGDYYDVIKVDDVVNIAIGDVTGHGLESGLLMLMVQTAVLVIHEAKISDTKEFFTVLNRSIFQNIQRLSSNKTITLALLTYSQGQVYLTGQHEELLVIRQQKTIERFDTIDLGFPIGLIPEIGEFIKTIAIDLMPGDTIVVFTDGIIEAENNEKEQFGIDRLCNTLLAYAHLEAQTMCDRVIECLLKFIDKQTIFDDITLLIAKTK